jgi:hypothetical protein
VSYLPSEGLREWVKVFSDVMVGTGAITAAVVAWQALNTWRAQLHGASRHERAKATLDEVLRVQDALRKSRDPFNGPAGEHYFECYLRMREALDSLDVSIRRARIYWPTQLAEPRRQIGRQVERFYVAVFKLRMMEEGTLDSLKMSDKQASEQAMAIDGMAQGSDRDELLADADAAAKGFEAILGEAAGSMVRRTWLPWRGTAGSNS